MKPALNWTPARLDRKCVCSFSPNLPKRFPTMIIWRSMHCFALVFPRMMVQKWRHVKNLKIWYKRFRILSIYFLPDMLKSQFTEFFFVLLFCSKDLYPQLNSVCSQCRPMRAQRLTAKGLFDDHAICPYSSYNKGWINSRGPEKHVFRHTPNCAAVGHKIIPQRITLNG